MAGTGGAEKRGREEILVRVDLDVDADVVGKSGRLGHPHPAGGSFPVQSWGHVAGPHFIYQEALPTPTRPPLHSWKPALCQGHGCEEDVISLPKTQP